MASPRPPRALRSATTGRTGLSARWVTLKRDESGNALVLAIAAVLLTGLLMGIVFSTVMFSVGHTTATRAQAASRAAAEGGAQQVARYLLQNSASASTPCMASWSSLDPTKWIDYDVDEVAYQATDGAAWTPCTTSSGVPKMAHAVRVKTTGYSKAVGQVGNERGNDATVEMVFVRPVSTVFEKAIYGEQFVNITNSIGLAQDPAVPGRPHTTLPADVVSPQGFFNCAVSPTVQGSVYALHGASLSSNCRIAGDLFVDFSKQPAGKQKVGANVTVGGNLYVIGDLDVPSGFSVGGSTYIMGNLHLSNSGPVFNGPTRITGAFSASNNVATSFPTSLLTGGVWDRTGPSSWNTNNSVNSMGARYAEAQPMTGPEWLPPSIFNTAANPITAAEQAATKLPMLTKADPMWSTFAVGDWDAMTTGIRLGSRCSAYDYTGPVRVMSDTQVDLTDCSSWSVQKLRLELHADLVIFVRDLQKAGSISVVSGNQPGDETRHTLYIVALPAVGQTQCAAWNDSNSNSAPGINFNEGTWNQRDASDGAIRTKVLLYSATVVNLRQQLSSTFSGQVYGCATQVMNNTQMVFAQAGTDLTQTLWDLKLASVRDITAP